MKSYEKCMCPEETKALINDHALSRRYTNEPEFQRTASRPRSRNHLQSQFQGMERRAASLSRRSVAIQLAVGVLANLAAISPGMNLGFSAVALPAMQSPNHTVQVTEDEASWIASLASVGTPLGCLLSGPLLDRWGRRLALFAINVPGLVGWTLLASASANNGFLAQVYAGRLLTGISTGMSCIPATVYIAETSDQSLRGMLVTWTSMFTALGILLVYLLGYCFPQDWRLVAGLCAVFPLMSAGVAWFLPESPVWLGNQGRTLEAELSLRRLRGLRAHEECPRHELDALLQCRNSSSRSVSFATLLRPEVWKPLLIMNAFFMFQQFAGIFVVVFYAIDIAYEAGVQTSGHLVSVLIGLTRLVVTIAISYASKRFGRRLLAILSGVGMTACMGALAGYLYLIHTGTVSTDMQSSLSWLPASFLVLYIFASTVGFLTLPWAMIGEVFPSHVRGLAGGATTCCAYLFCFAIVKVYPQMKHSLNRHGVFCFYGAVALLGTVFVWFCLPETQGKTLEEVEQHFARKKTDRPVVVPAETKS